MAEDDEKIGYRRPPRRTQFKPGQSGNPTGKTKGLRTIAAELQDILNEQVSYTADGAIKTMSKQKALASALVSAAISGDLRATAIVMSHLTRESQKTPEGDTGDTDDFSAVVAHRKRKPKL
jgi:hypothetical protein